MAKYFRYSPDDTVEMCDKVIEVFEEIKLSAEGALQRGETPEESEALARAWVFSLEAPVKANSIDAVVRAAVRFVDPVVRQNVAPSSLQDELEEAVAGFLRANHSYDL